MVVGGVHGGRGWRGRGPGGRGPDRCSPVASGSRGSPVGGRRGGNVHLAPLIRRLLMGSSHLAEFVGDAVVAGGRRRGRRAHHPCLHVSAAGLIAGWLWQRPVVVAGGFLETAVAAGDRQLPLGEPRTVRLAHPEALPPEDVGGLGGGRRRGRLGGNDVVALGGRRGLDVGRGPGDPRPLPQVGLGGGPLDGGRRRSVLVTAAGLEDRFVAGRGRGGGRSLQVNVVREVGVAAGVRLGRPVVGGGGHAGLGDGTRGLGAAATAQLADAEVVQGGRGGGGVAALDALDCQRGGAGTVSWKMDVC